MFDGPEIGQSPLAFDETVSSLSKLQYSQTLSFWIPSFDESLRAHNHSNCKIM